MVNKFLFFDFKRSKLLNILIIGQVVLWVFYTASLVSLINFDQSYKNRYNRAFKIENSAVMVFYKMVAKIGTNESKRNYSNQIKEALKYLENNNYKYGLMMQPNNEDIPLEVLGATIKDLRPNFTRTEGFYDSIYPIYFNWHMLNSYKENIEGDIDFEQWQEKDNSIPTILGSNYAKRFKVGDGFEYDGKKYIIKGFFKKDLMAFDSHSTVDSSFLLNGSLVVPLSEDLYFDKLSFNNPIVVYFNGKKQDELTKLSENIANISSDIVIKGFDKDLNEFLEELKTKRIFETMRILIISVIATASIITTIIYKIMSDKDRIGVLYSLGISKVKIFRIFSLEFIINIFLGIIGGSLFYLKNCKKVYAFFINENLLVNLYISIFLLLILIFSVLLLGFKEINKLSPKEMVGGFKE